MTKYEIRSKMTIDQRWLERGVLAIDARQTADEQEDDETKHDNGRGWNKPDAGYGSYLARYIRTCKRVEGQRLSGYHVIKAKAMMWKYAGQLARIVAAKKAVAA